MKNVVSLIIGIAMLSVLTSSCKKSGSSSAFNKSYDAWLSFKASVNDSYSYLVVHESTTGYYTETTITVKNGVIIKRDYYQYAYSYTPGSNDGVQKVLNKEWHETSDLGTHGIEGATLYTIDDVYNQAQNFWLRVDGDKNDTVFETSSDGIISKAGYIPKSCKTDCFIGITIRSISK